MKIQALTSKMYELVSPLD